MAAKFEACKGKYGEPRFKLKAGNGEVIFSSQGNNASASCSYANAAGAVIVDPGRSLIIV